MQRLLYISRATGLWTGTLSADVAAIAISCTHYNFRHGVTGVLAFRNGYFMQLLEGDRNAIKALFKRIGADQRHERMIVLAVESGESRQFAHWSFRLSPASDLGEPFKAFVERHWAAIASKQDADVVASVRLFHDPDRSVVPTTEGVGRGLSLSTLEGVQLRTRVITPAVCRGLGQSQLDAVAALLGGWCELSDLLKIKGLNPSALQTLLNSLQQEGQLLTRTKPLTPQVPTYVGAKPSRGFLSRLRNLLLLSGA